MGPHFMRHIIIVLICSICWSNLWSQKVALVLSGGGAKGLAHVGVLKVLEENHVPIDYIVGTSMGGVIGGFYAAGYSAREIEQLVVDPTFQEWVDGKLSADYNFFYARKDDNASILNLNLAVDSAVNLNSNLASDFAINYALTELLAPASQSSGYDFDSLHIPFRAIAADIFTQKVVILKKGALNEALRATLSVPFFFRPLRVSGKYLFDGGIYNNFPVDVAREEFNPDVIIGVNVSSRIFDDYPYQEDDELIKSSLLAMLLDKPNVNLLQPGDIYIAPQVDKYSALDFQDVRALIDSGMVEATTRLPEIKQKIRRELSCDSLAESRLDFVLNAEPLRFGALQIDGFTSQQKRYIRRLFSDKEFLNIYDIRSGYYKLVSESYFRNSIPGITYDSINQSYNFTVSGETSGNFNVELGGNISSRSVSSIFLGLNFTHFNHLLFNHSLNFYTGRFYQAFRHASRFNIPTAKPFFVEPVFIYNHWDYIDANEILLAKKDPTLIDEIDRKGRINIGFAVGTGARLRFHSSYFSNTYRFSNEEFINTTDTLDELNFTGFRHGIDISKNNLNRKQYASTGQSLYIGADYISADEEIVPGTTSPLAEEQKKNNNWVRLKVRSEAYFGKGRFKYGYLLESVLSNQSTSFTLSGSRITSPAFTPMVDSPTLFLENFRAYNYLAGGLRNIYSIDRNLDFRLEGYIFKPFRELRISEDQDVTLSGDLTKAYFAGTATMVYHSPLGPIALQLNYYDDEQNRFGALLHVGYLLFNKKPLE